MQVLPYLGKQFPEAQKGFSQQVAHQLAECLIALPGSTERTAARALDAAASFDDPLFVGESQLNPVSPDEHGRLACVFQDSDTQFWQKII